jgi:hypothetical protein
MKAQGGNGLAKIFQLGMAGVRERKILENPI